MPPARLTSPTFCTSASEKVYFTAWCRETGFEVQDAVGWLCSGAEGATIFQGVGSWVYLRETSPECGDEDKSRITPHSSSPVVGS